MATIVGKADGYIVIDTKINTNGFNKGAADLKTQFSGLGASVKKMGALAAAAFSVNAIVAFGKEAIQLGSDLQEVQNVVDVTFTTLNEEVNEFAKNAAMTAGLSETMAKRYAGTFGAMAKSFRFTEEEAFNMSTALTQLAGDVASFYNITQDEAYTKLKSVFTGETETMKDLGVVMTQTALDDFALRKGLTKTTDQMTEQEKVALRYQFVLEQLNAASGDFLRTSGSWANQTRLLSLQFDQLKATIGQGLINALTPAIKVLNEMIAKFQTLADSFLAFTKAVFGDAGGASAALKETAESASEVAEGIEEAGKTEKKYLASFDEITKIGKTAGEEGTIIPTIPRTEAKETEDKYAFETTPTWITRMKALIDDVLKPLQEIDMRYLLKSVKSLAKTFKNLGGNIGRKLKELWIDVLSPMEAWSIEKAIPVVIDAIADAFDFLGDVLDWAWPVLKPAIAFFSELAKALLTIPLAVLEGLGDWLKGFGNLLNPTAEGAYILSEAEKELAEKASSAAIAFQDLKLSTEESEDAIQSQLAHVERLWKELDNLADADGKVLDANKSRVQFILNELNAALGTEYGMVGNVISGYQNLRGEIEKVIAAKKANLLLEANEEEYRAALMSQEDAWDYYQQKLREVNAQKQKVEQMLADYHKGGISSNQINAEGQLYNELLKEAQELKETYLGYVSTISNYEQASRLVLEENYDEATKILLGTNIAFEEHAEIAESETDRAIAALKKELAAAERIAEQTKLAFENGIAGYTQEMVDEAEKAVEQVLEKLLSMKSLLNNAFGVVGPSVAFSPSVLSVAFTPSVPYLAQGAVIPPRTPFMAMLGDQSAGYNLEGPESMFRGIVREEMAAFIGDMMGGFEALIEENIRLRQTVENIEVGDSVIGQAADRYNQRMAIMKGGY